MSTNLSNPSNSLAKIRWQEPYVSEGLNRKLNGVVPAGVIRGGVLSTNLAAMSVTLLADPVTGDSVYSYIDANGNQITFRQVGDVTLDLSGVPGTPLVVYVALYVSYSAGAPTAVYWRAYTTAELFGGAPVAEADYVVVNGEVDLPAAGVIPAANITPNRRRSAWTKVSEGIREWRLVTPEGGFQSCSVSLLSADPAWGGFDTEMLTTAVAIAPVEVTTAQYRSGDRSLHMHLVGAAPQLAVVAHAAQFEVTEGDMVDLSVWVMGVLVAPGPGVAGHLGVMIEFYDAAGAVVSTEYADDISLVGSFAWTEVSSILEAPATATSARVYVICDDNNALSTGDYYFDDLKVWVRGGQSRDPNGVDDLTRGSVRSNSIEVAPITTSVSINSLITQTIRLFQTLPSGGLLRLSMRSRGALATNPFALLLDAGALTIDRVIEGLGADMIGSAANAAIARITSPIPATGTSAYVLLAHFTQTSAKGPIRIYASGLSTLVTGDEFLFVTINAEWDDAANNWVRDIAANSVLFGVAVEGIYLRWYPAGSASPWTHAQWVSPGEGLMSVVRDVGGGTRALLNDALIRFVNATVLTNPAAATAPLSNALYAKNMPKAFARVSTNGAGAITLVDGFNVSAVALVGGAPNKCRVTFHVPFATTNYGFTQGIQDLGANTDTIIMDGAGVALGTCGFIYSAAGIAVDLAAVAKIFMLSFFGEQAS